MPKGEKSEIRKRKRSHCSMLTSRNENKLMRADRKHARRVRPVRARGRPPFSFSKMREVGRKDKEQKQRSSRTLRAVCTVKNGAKCKKMGVGRNTGARETKVISHFGRRRLSAFRRRTGVLGLTTGRGGAALRDADLGCSRCQQFLRSFGLFVCLRECG